jgi:cell wall assembly regulator SMI1
VTPTAEEERAASVNLLARLDTVLRASRPEYHAKNLRSPASLDALTAAEKEVGAALPVALRELYLWRDGESTDRRDEGLLGQWFFVSLERALELRRSELGDASETAAMIARDGPLEPNEEDELPPRTRWNPRFFPFMTNGAAQLACVDLSQERRAPVVHCFTLASEETVSYPSVFAFLKTVALAYEAGWRNGILDDAIVEGVRRKLCKGIAGVTGFFLSSSKPRARKSPPPTGTRGKKRRR